MSTTVSWVSSNSLLPQFCHRYGFNNFPFEIPFIFDMNIPTYWASIFPSIHSWLESKNTIITVTLADKFTQEFFSRVCESELSLPISKITMTTRLSPYEFLERVLDEFDTHLPDAELSIDDAMVLAHELILAKKSRLFFLAEMDNCSEQTRHLIHNWVSLQKNDERPAIRFLLFSENRVPISTDESIYLRPLSITEVKPYLQEVLAHAGLQGDFPFTVENINYIYELSAGHMGRINHISERLLREKAQEPEALALSGWERYRLAGITAIMVMVASGLYVYNVYLDILAESLDQDEVTVIQASLPNPVSVALSQRTVISKPALHAAVDGVEKSLAQSTRLNPQSTVALKQFEKPWDINQITQTEESNETLANLLSSQLLSSEHKQEKSMPDKLLPTVAEHLDKKKQASTIVEQEMSSAIKLSSKDEIATKVTLQAEPVPAVADKKIVGEQENPAAILFTPKSSVAETVKQPMPVVSSQQVTKPLKPTSELSRQSTLSHSSSDVIDIEHLDENIDPDGLASFQNKGEIDAMLEGVASSTVAPEVRASTNPIVNAMPSPSVKPIVNAASSPSVKPSVSSMPTVSELPKSGFTIQLLAMTDSNAIALFRRQHQLPQEVFEYHVDRRGKEWILLLYGHYPSKEAAQKVLATLPANLAKQGAWIRSLGDIKPA